MMKMEETIKELKKLNARKIFIQSPEGLKLKIQDISKQLEKEGFETVIWLERCFGSCDIRNEAKLLDCDAILHIGHSDMGVKSELPVIYEEYRIDFDPVTILEKNLNELREYKKICLITTLQYLASLKLAKRFLESKRKKIFIGLPVKAKYPGQVLGCDFSAAKPLESLVDCFLFLGTGMFHVLGLLQKVKKPILFLDFEKGELLNLEEKGERLERIKLMQIEEAKSLKNFGILVSTKLGQLSIKTAEKVKKKLEGLGKNAWILVMDELEPSKLMGLDIDCLVNCACPRLTEDTERFEKPILDPADVDKLVAKPVKPSYE